MTQVARAGRSGPRPRCPGGRGDVPAARARGAAGGAELRRGPALRARAGAGGPGAAGGARQLHEAVDTRRHTRAAAADRPVREPRRSGWPATSTTPSRSRVSGLAEQAGDDDLRGLLELEMVCSMMLSADTVEEGYERVRAHGSAGRDSLWRIPLAWEVSAADGGPADEVRALLAPVLDAVTPPRGHGLAGQHVGEVHADRQRRLRGGPPALRRPGRAGPAAGMADRAGPRQLRPGDRADPPRDGSTTPARMPRCRSGSSWPTARRRP